MKKTFLCAFVMLLFCCVTAPASHAEDDWDRPIKGNPDYADVRTQLQVLVNLFANHKINRFCVVADHDPTDKAALVYWPGQHQLITWEPGQKLFALVDSRDLLDLWQDVVANDDEVGTSTYLVTRGWVNEVVADCRKFGNAYTIKKTAGNWISIKTSSLFADMNDQLQTLVNEQASKKTNHFCIIGQNDVSFLTAYIYWREEDRLILWSPVPDRSALLEDVDESYGVDLKTGSVTDPRGSNVFDSHMPRSYMRAALRACQASSEKFIVTKSDK